MLVKNISLKNFLSYQNEALDISTDGIYLIIGNLENGISSNGIGKSSLIKDSVTYCLFGIARDNNDLDSLIYVGKEEMVVQLSFELEGLSYVVKRNRVRGKSTQLKLMRNDEDISEKTVKETQQKIESLLGMDYGVFTASVCFEQGLSNKFSVLTPKQSKQFILNLLQLTQYEVYKKRTKELEKSVDLEITKLQNILESTKTQLPSIQLIGLEKLIQYYKKVEEQVRVLDEEKNKIGIDKNKYLQEISRVTAITSETVKSKKEFEQQLEEIVKIKGQCPLCLSTLTEEQIVGLKSKVNENIKNIQSRISEYLKQIDGYKQQANTFNFDENKLAELRNKLLQIRTKIGQEKAYKEQETRLQKLQDTYKESQVNLPILLKKKEQLGKLIEAFDENGIPTYIIENTLPEVENVVNELMTQLTEGRIQISFETQKELKSGEKAETLQIMINDEAGTRNYQMYSGGEKFLIDFALRIAISVILTRRSGHKIQTLIIDEGFGSLDNSNSEKLVELINYIHQHLGFRRIFIVSHKEEIKDSFSKIITIYKDLNGSHINR